MSQDRQDREEVVPHCCPSCQGPPSALGAAGKSYVRGLDGAAALGTALAGLSWAALAADGAELPEAPPRRPLVVQPIFTYPLATRRPQTSWRNWGGIETGQDVEAEAARIRGELEKLRAKADFPVTMLPLAAIRTPGELSGIGGLAKADALLVWAAGDGAGNLMAAMNPIAALGKDTIFFVRHQSGPLYYWYEGIMARFLHQHTDALGVRGIDYDDVVVDRLDEVLWRLRALCGLRNTVGSRIVAIGGPGAWSAPAPITELIKKRWQMDIRTVSYDELGKLIRAARGDKQAVALANRRADAYLGLPGTRLETDKTFVQKAFLLEQVFRGLMKAAGCRAMTIAGCMGTVMPISETTACLPLSTLNDDGYLAFCESDFVVIPAGILLAGISGLPTFLNDPTYPHDEIITLAHCTAPRRMDGKTVEPARIMTHFESDYGAAPKVEMGTGRKLTNVLPDFAADRWVGLSGEVVDHPLLPICRSQIDVCFPCSSQLLAERMPGFHWMTVYGDWLRETGYALRRVGIRWECLG
jgi:hypothetical protein